MVLDQDGTALDPTRTESAWIVSREYPKLERQQVDTYVDSLMASIGKHVDGGKSRVLLFINGGLNGIESSVKRSNGLTKTILSESRIEDSAYPVFIAWDSDLFGSWLQDTFVVRRGQKNLGFGLISWPFQVIEDLGRGLLHVPQNFIYYNPDTYMRGNYRYTPQTISASQAVSAALARRADECHAGSEGDMAQFETDPDAVDSPFFLLRLVHWFVLQPIQAIPNIFVDGMGASAWDEMERRTQLLFESEEASKAGSICPPEDTALIVFLKRLRQLQKEKGFQVDLYCHSMGCIVANRIMDLAVNDKNDSFPRLHHIVYMGAACSIGDYERSAFPYLQREIERANGSKGVEQPPHFYHVTLHERMESKETHFFWLTPYGSLLAWIDNYYARTRTPSDLVLGRFTNLMQGYARTPQSLRENIHVRSYGLDSRGGTQPVEHGDFDECKFWRRSFYVPDATKGWDPDS